MAGSILAHEPAPVPGPRRRVLVVEDHEPIRKVVGRVLERAGHEVTEVGRGDVALELLERVPFDLVVLDLRLPDTDGLEVLAALRERRDTPTIVVSGRDAGADRVLALSAGADDYVTKPFAPGELTARVHAVLRRADRSRIDERLVFGDLEIDVATRRVSLGGHAVLLGSREFDLLGALAGRAGRSCSREELLLWAWGVSADARALAELAEHVQGLRSKIEADPARPRRILTVPGVGYRFEP